MSIRTDIFNNNTTLFGILDEEGIPETNKRFREVEDRISTLESRTLQTQTQLIDLSTVVAKNRADYNAFELKTNNTLTSLEEGVLEANSLAVAADLMAKRAEENANAALSLTHQLEVTVVKLDNDLIRVRQAVEVLDGKVTVQGLELEVVHNSISSLESQIEAQSTQIATQSNQIKSLQDQVATLGNPYVILQRRTNFYYRDGTVNKTLFIDWDTPSKADTIVLANVGYWAMITSSDGGVRRGLVTLIADWDTFRLVGTIAYPILQGAVRCQTIIGSSTDSYTGTALVDK